MQVGIILLLAWLSGSVGLGPSKAAHQPGSVRNIHWSSNYPEAKADALAHHRFLIVDMETDWCSWCRVMDAEVYPAPQVARELHERYVCVRKNAESDSDGFALQRKFHVTTYPATIVVNPADDMYVTIYGYHGVEQFLQEVKVATKELRNLDHLADRVRTGKATVPERGALAEAFAERGLYDQAAKLYIALLADPRVNLRPKEQIRAAVALASAGDDAHALAEIADIERSAPDSGAVPEAKALEGEILWHEGNAARARQVLNEWLAKYPNNPLAEHVRSVLSQVGRTH